jgi:outer membrane protein OmpA-like peptidoglycan-associated protein
MRTFLLSAAASVALASAASAAAPNSWYFSLEGGGNWVEDVNFASSFDADPPGGALVLGLGEAQFDRGWAALGAVGYAFGNNWRAELEGGYRYNDFDASPGLELAEWSAMVNVLYDIHLSRAARLSLGVGAGGDYGTFESTPIAFDESEWNFAYQGIAGFSYALSDHVDLIATYRYLRVHEPEFTGPAVTPGPTPGTQTFFLDDVAKHTATVGLRYSFGVAAQEPVVAPPPPPPPPAEPALPREFIVFFGHNRSDLTPEAQDVVRQAADAAKKYGSSTVTVVGHADRSGSTIYNQKLSLKRGTTVKGALVAEGIAEGSISVSGKGEGDPMVPTADGVREPQNRRVHITL